MSAQNSSNSIYQPLRSSTSIRILQLARNETGSIEIQLKTVDLDKKKCPDFTTISYVWGTAMSKQSVSINSEPRLVLETVQPLLDQLCDNPDFAGDIYFWIDSICINQADLKEREAQVSLMHRVFRQSQRTIAWLGPNSPTTDDAMDFLVTLSQTRGPQEHYVRHGNRRIYHGFNVPSKWQSLQHLFSLPWWTRAWTLQEMVMPRELVFYCGTKHIDDHAFAAALSNLWCCNPSENLIRSATWRRAWTRLRLIRWYSFEPWRDSISLLSLLAYSGNCQVTNPRDRIYSLLGVARQDDRELAGPPDYTLGVATIYTNLVKNFIQKRKSLDIICLAHLFRAGGDKSGEGGQGQGTPTWVPDWSVHVEPFVTPTMVSQGAKNLMPAFDPSGPVIHGERPAYNAGLQIPSMRHISFSEDGRLLTCRGYEIDRIDGLSAIEPKIVERLEPRGNRLNQSTSVENQPPSSSTGQRECDPKEEEEDILRLVDTIIRCLMVDRKDRYLTKPLSDSMQQLRSQLGGALTTTIDFVDEGMLENFRSWLARNQSLLVRGKTLQEIFDEFVMRPHSGSDQGDGGGPYGPLSKITTSEDSLLSRFRDTAMTMARRFITTNKGYIGMSPSQARKDDLVCVLFGCSVPVVLRPVISVPGGENTNTSTYEFVGECYLDGYMYGEKIPYRRRPPQTGTGGYMDCVSRVLGLGEDDQQQEQDGEQSFTLV